MTPEFKLIRNLHEIDAPSWNALAGTHPFLQHDFLLALDASGCATPETGWSPHYLLMHRGGGLAGAMPLYLKSHSRGEYVFDYAWANAFAQHGLTYYPKLLAAVPFTPVPGPRLLAGDTADRVLLARAAAAIARDNGLSSLHVLFPDSDDQVALQQAGFLMRESVQFHWFNQDYRSMDDFLARLTQPKRKKIKQDCKKAAQAGVRFRWLHSGQISQRDLDFFYRCYQQTYLDHGNPPYLSKTFFERLRACMPDALLIVQAERNGHPIAAALNICGDDRLYGRYWGSIEYVPGLHFVTCYLQGIEYCIEKGLAVFEGGAQGEHKLSRGMLPVPTRSAHWIADERYARAIADFLEREAQVMDAYIDELNEHAPYRNRADSQPAHPDARHAAAANKDATK
nr:GNAT family N-acetyltransferase [Allopusillimonas soli]